MAIIQNISRFFQTIQQPFIVLSNINRQKKFIRKNISPLLGEAEKAADDSLDENDLKKITGYYGLAVPAVLGEAFCTLRDYPMSKKERLASTCQGAMTGLGDDFFDRQRLSPLQVKEFIETPERFDGNTESEKLFLYFYKTALTNAPDAELLKRQILRVFESQMLSKQQDNPGLSYEVIKDISISKGAESLLYYRTVFEHSMKPGEEKMLYALGGLMQLSNDIFDVYKDQQDGVHTLVTTAWDIRQLRTTYAALLEIGIASTLRCGYPKTAVRRFLGMISIGIFSRCFVCLDQLQRVQKKHGGDFNPAKYQRKELICDMDTFGNKMRSLKYHFKISRGFR